MIPMSERKCIRFLRQKKGKSINEIAEFLDRDWDTVEKYGDSEILPQPKKRQRKRPKIGDYEETIKGWLSEDLLKKKKQRRNAATIHEQLKQLEYEGSARTTRYWVSKWKKQIIASRETAHIRLEHPPGESQVDLFDVWVVDANRNYQLRKMHLLQMSFPYSSGCLAVLIPAENIECILQGLTWLFEELGGVPPVLIFDNLKPVVKKVLLRGKRTLTDAFERFKYYYRFEAKFCNPASGHEKGSTECKGGYTRRRYLSPYPVLDDLDSLNKDLLTKLREDMNRQHYRKEAAISELFEEDRAVLLKLPRDSYEAERITSAVVNQVGEIKISGRSVHLPWCHPGQRVMVKVYWDRLEVLDENGENFLGSCPRPYAFKLENVDWAAEWKLFLNKPRAVEQAHCLKSMPPKIKNFVTEMSLGKRRKRIEILIGLFERNYSVEEICRVIETAREYGRMDAASIFSIAGYQDTFDDLPPIKEEITPAAIKDWKPNLRKYSMLGGVAGGK